MARIAGLSVDVIVRAALELADSDGFDKLSMRRLAAALDVSPMAIYHHVTRKSDLLDLVIDESLRPLPTLDGEGDPTEQLVTWFTAFHRLLVEHPSLAQGMAGRRLEGPVAAVAADQMVEAALSAGLDERVAIDLVVSAFTFALGAGVYRASRSAADSERGRRNLPGGLRRRDQLADATDSDDRFSHGLRLLVAAYLDEGRDT